MAAARTAWHVLLAVLLHQRAPRRFEVHREVPLSTEPLRADYLLLSNLPETNLPEANDGDPAPPPKRWRLWNLLPKDTLVEFKSTGRPYRSRNMSRFWAYLHLYYADQPVRLLTPDDLAGVLLVASRTPTLEADVKALGLAWEDLGGGYWKLCGGPFVPYVVEIDVVAEAEDDDLLRLFGHAEPHTLEAHRWLYEQGGTKERAMEIHDLEGYDEIIQKIVTGLPPEKVLSAFKPEQRLAGLPPEQRLAGLPPEQRLAGLPPEQRLAGLPPEQRLAGLPPDQAVLALPDELLRALSDEYLESLPADIRAVVRDRIGR
jgi:hypothetical protein